MRIVSSSRIWRSLIFWLANERGVGFCNIDLPAIGRSLRPSQRATAAVGYVRLDGRNYEQWFQEREEGEGAERRYNSLYSVQELEPWAERIRRVAAGVRSTFVVTNNHFRGKAVTNALQLLHLLKRTRVKVPPPLLQLYPEELEPIASHKGTTPSLFSPA